MSKHQIPFNEKSDQMPHDGFGRAYSCDNFEFEDTLEYVNYSKGRSSVGFEFKRTDGRMVSMFLTDFHAIVPLMVCGKIAGKFTFTKRGTAYGCKRIGNGNATTIVISGPRPPAADSEFIGDLVRLVSEELYVLGSCMSIQIATGPSGMRRDYVFDVINS